MVDRGGDWAAWVHALPRRRDDLMAEWGLREDGLSMHGYTSLVVPVRDEDDRPLALKVTYDGDDETEHEALALQHWGGRGAVRLLRADPRRRAVLLERLARTDLTTVPDVEACRVVAGLYPVLEVPAPPQLRTVTSYVGRWVEPMRALPRDAPIPHRMVEHWLSLVADLTADPRCTGRIVHGDLHHENVLAAPEGGWRVIDPQPMSGDVHYELAPMLFNRWEEVAGDVRAGVRRRFHALVDEAGLDEGLARDWVVVRMVLNAYWAIEDAERLGRPLDTDEREWITTCLAVTKAVQD
jgi:streptomycin 6-kinase